MERLADDTPAPETHCLQCGVFLGDSEFPDGGMVERHHEATDYCVECCRDFRLTLADEAYGHRE